MLAISLRGISGSDSVHKNLVSPSTLRGKWKLFELLTDPGDDSGTFASINSFKSISLFSEGAFSYN